jgi:hypothetical protein
MPSCSLIPPRLKPARGNAPMANNTRKLLRGPHHPHREASATSPSSHSCRRCWWWSLNGKLLPSSASPSTCSTKCLNNDNIPVGEFSSPWSPLLRRPSCRGVVPWCVPMLACTAPPRDRRRLCADHRVEPYAYRCRCQWSARAPRLTFLSFSQFSFKKIMERICHEYT